MSRHSVIADDSYRMSLIIPKEYHDAIRIVAEGRRVLPSDVYREAIANFIYKEKKCQASQK